MSLSSFFSLFVPRLTELLTHLTMALGGRAGARLSAHLDAAVSRMSLLRSIRTRPETAVETPRVLYTSSDRARFRQGDTEHGTYCAGEVGAVSETRVLGSRRGGSRPVDVRRRADGNRVSP
ncbi:hypothetical protein GCM10028793_54100 [Nocardiopsis oceani]